MSRKMKLTTRILSVFLSIVLLFEVVPMQVFAAEQPAAEIGAQQEEVLTDETPEENTESEAEPAEFLSEDTEKREENVKHFRMSDGTMQAAQYAEPVHFLKDGVWTDYDNTLTEVDAEAEEKITAFGFLKRPTARSLYVLKKTDTSCLGIMSVQIRAQRR